ncbi:MAG: thioredoxin-dependent thiol peroxidase [Bacteroidota bacterium]|jgi:thioredoxin-dependent peroxiredoxin
MLKIGKKAPDFNLLSGDGKKYSLKDFAGRKLVLYFYPRDNTSGCTEEARSFEKKRGAMKKNGAIVVGVSTDSVDSHAKFASKYGLTFPLLSDEKKSVVKVFGVWKEKSMYGKKYFGVERTTVVIDEKGIIRHIFHRVKVEGHADEVLNVLKKGK